MSELSDTPLPRIPYLRLRTTLRAEEPAALPAYKGSTLRGAFGPALRRLVCVMGPEQPCESCLARRTCHHARLFETFVEGEPPPFLQGIATADLGWRDWQRYINRQRAPMTLGGFVGTLEIEGDLAPFVPLLRTAEVVHVGKGATFGLGKIELAPAAL